MPVVVKALYSPTHCITLCEVHCNSTDPMPPQPDCISTDSTNSFASFTVPIYHVNWQ